jgi:hypothetical protein
VAKKLIIMTYNEFQSACKEAWRTEGQGSNIVRIAHICLCRVEKIVGMPKSALISAAWKIYKSGK